MDDTAQGQTVTSGKLVLHPQPDIGRIDDVGTPDQLTGSLSFDYRTVLIGKERSENSATPSATTVKAPPVRSIAE